MSLLTFLKTFPDDDACWAHLEALRWPSGPVCPQCGSVNNAHLVGRAHYRRCNVCRAKFKVTHGTPFEGTHLPMRTWFTALYLVAASSKGVSSVKLGEHLGVGQKTAWFLGQRIRRMMEADDGLLRGIVEVDETYLGGKKRTKGEMSKRDGDDDQPTGRGGSRKAVVTVAAERGGRARAAKGKTHSGRTVKPSGLPDIAAFVFGNVSRDGTVSGEPLGSTLVSDELPACRWPDAERQSGIGRKFGAHLRVNHSKSGEPLGSTGEYVRYDRHAPATAHVNTAESFNATLKRAWVGVFPRKSLRDFAGFPSQTSCFDDIKHIDRYLNEATFRWNARVQNAEQRLSALFTGSAGRLRWKELVA